MADQDVATTAVAARHHRWWLVLGVLGVLAYVGTWAVLGVVADGYDPFRQAISELFDLGVPAWQRRTLAGVLLVTGLGLLPLGPVLHRTLPGRGLLGPALVVVAGLGTAAVAFFPCTAGCPGVGSSATDTWHVVTAGSGYAGLVTAPIAFGVRLRRAAAADDARARGSAWRRVATAGLLLGGAATVGFVVRNLGVDVLAGLQQRVFNTLADAWYVVAAVAVLRERASGHPDGD